MIEMKPIQPQPNPNETNQEPVPSTEGEPSQSTPTNWFPDKVESKPVEPTENPPVNQLLAFTRLAETALASQEPALLALFDQGYDLSGISHPGDRQCDDGQERLYAALERYQTGGFEKEEVEIALPPTALSPEAIVSSPTDPRLTAFLRQAIEILGESRAELEPILAEDFQLTGFVHSGEHQCDDGKERFQVLFERYGANGFEHHELTIARPIEEAAVSS